MKKIYLLIFALSFAIISNAQHWNVNTNGIHYNNGNVGIGTGLPADKLEIKGNGGGVLRFSNDNTSYLASQNVITGNLRNIASQWNNDYSATNSNETSAIKFGYYAHVHGQVFDAAIRFYTQENGSGLTKERMSIVAGNVGIGTVTPTQKLDVNGYLKVGGTDFSQILLADRYWSGSHAILFNASPSPSFVDGDLATTGNTKFANNAGSYSGGAGGIFFNGNGGNMYFRISEISTGQGNDIDWGTPELTIQRNGYVGIGTDAPDAKLAVKGNIHTQEVKVDLNGAMAPDFVFEDDYKLLTLKETEEYIKKNKHLPEIPAASEMEENGFKLKEMNLKLLQKVEELTLHLIEQSKKIQKLEQEVSVLKN